MHHGLLAGWAIAGSSVSRQSQLSLQSGWKMNCFLSEMLKQLLDSLYGRSLVAQSPYKHCLGDSGGEWSVEAQLNRAVSRFGTLAS